MNFKRHRSKNRRAGCLACKPWKSTRIGDRRVPRPAERRRAEGHRQELAVLDGRERHATAHASRAKARRAYAARPVDPGLVPGDDLAFRCFFSPNRAGARSAGG